MSVQRKILNNVERVALDCYEAIRIPVYRFNERLKFRDKRRAQIANQYPLTAEQKERIDELYVKNYGQRISYVWHQNYAAHAGKFDFRFIPELLYIPEFETFQNRHKAAVSMMSDKNFLPLVAKAAGVRMPRTIVSCTNGLLRDGENHIISPAMADELIRKQCSFFVKPSVDSSSGQGCMRVDDADEYHFDGNVLTSRSGGGDFSELCLSRTYHLSRIHQEDISWKRKYIQGHQLFVA